MKQQLTEEYTSTQTSISYKSPGKARKQQNEQAFICFVHNYNKGEEVESALLRRTLHTSPSPSSVPRAPLNPTSKATLAKTAPSLFCCARLWLKSKLLCKQHFIQGQEFPQNRASYQNGRMQDGFLILPDTTGGSNHTCSDYNLAPSVLVSVFILLKYVLYLCSSLSRRTAAYPVRIAAKDPEAWCKIA